MRVSSLARSYNVRSKDVIELANMTGENLKSASSRVEVTRDNRIYWHSICSAAQKRRDAGKSNLILRVN